MGGGYDKSDLYLQQSDLERGYLSWLGAVILPQLRPGQPSIPGPPFDDGAHPGLQDVITHPLAGTCFRCKISRLRQYRTAAALKVIINEMPVMRRGAKPFVSSLLESY